jgi:hypothetical protein
MSSGSYIPPLVLRVEIPKGDGEMRVLGIPTVADRIAQMVVKNHIEPELEKCSMWILKVTGQNDQPSKQCRLFGSVVGNMIGLSTWISKDSLTTYP